MSAETADLSPLFKPLFVHGKTLRNRIVMPPMVQLRSSSKYDAKRRETSVAGIQIKHRCDQRKSKGQVKHR